MTKLRFTLMLSLLPTLLTLGLCFVPLFDLLGYEYCLALTFILAPCSVVIGMRIARHSTSHCQGWLNALCAASLLLLPSLVFILLNGLRIQNCDYLQGFEFFMLLPWGSALYGASLGALYGRLSLKPRLGRDTLWLTLIIFAPLAWSLWILYAEPPVFAFDHLWGYFAGSLYDEAIHVDERLEFFRFGTLLRIAAIGLFFYILDKRQQRTLLGLTAVILVILLASYEVYVGSWAKFRITHHDIERALPITVKRAGLVLHFPAHTPQDVQKAMADAHAFRRSQIASRLQIRPPFVIHSYIFTNQADKKLWTGLSKTSITKPWLHEIYIDGFEIPHPIMAHELVHAIAATFGASIFKISTTPLGWPNIGLTEGLAVALAPLHGNLTLDQSTKALNQQGKVPSVNQLFDPNGFWRLPAREAYTISGSFVNYLLRTYGPHAFEKLYGHSNFQEAYGRTAESLAHQWLLSLQKTPLSPQLLNTAKAQFSRTSIFDRQCAHTIADLRQKATTVSRAKAQQIYAKIANYLPNNLQAQIDLANAQLEAGKTNAFQQTAEQLLAQTASLKPQERTFLLGKLGDLYWHHNDFNQARANFSQAMQWSSSPAITRLNFVKLWAINQPQQVQQAIGPLLRDQLTAKQKPMAILETLHTQEPDNSTVSYMLARQWLHAGKTSEALTLLKKIGTYPFAAIEAERTRLIGVAAWRLKDYKLARQAFERYRGKAPNLAEQERASDWIQRIQWSLLNKQAQQKALQQ